MAGRYLLVVHLRQRPALNLISALEVVRQV